MAAAAAMVALLTVVPLVLVRLTAALPLDPSAVSLDGLLRPDDGGLLLVMMAALAWSSWAILAVSVIVELVAALRGVPTPRIPGLSAPQRVAGALVTALLVGTLPLAASTGQPSVDSLDLAAAVVSTEVDDIVDQLDGRAAGPLVRGDRANPPVQAIAAELPTILVQRHDTLWLLAEQHLGSGERFAEIVALNRGVRQKDGRALRDDGRLYPGWTLRLPEDADLKAPRPGRIVVQPGDTLWDIADHELHDPTRFRELVQENRGDLQPDGRRLRDADLIHPGWVIALPSDAPDGVAARPTQRESQPGSGAGSRASADRGAQAAAALDGRAGPPATVAPTPEVRTDSAVPPSGLRPSAGETPRPAATGGPSQAAASPGPASVAAIPSSDAALDGGSASPAATASSVAESDIAVGEGDSSDDGLVTSSEERAGIALPAGGVAAALLVAALAVELVRRRQLFQRWRRPGERLPLPSARARRLEASLTKGVAARDGALLASTLGALGEAYATAHVRVLELGPEGVRLRLGQDWGSPVPPEPFRLIGPRVLAASREGLDAWVGEPSPMSGRALITVGTQGDRTILIDLETVGTLHLAGDDVIVGAVVQAIAAEVALDERHRGSTRTLCLLDPQIAGAAEAGEVIVDADAQRVGRAVATALRRARGTGSSGGPVSSPSEAAPQVPRATASMPGGEFVGPRTPRAAPVAVLDAPAVVDLRTTGTGGEPVGVSTRSAGESARSPAGSAPSGGASASSEPSPLAQPHASNVGPSTSHAEWGDPFEMVVAEQPIGVAVPPGSGVGLVTSAAPTGTVGLTLSVLDVARAVLVEDGIELVPVGLTGETVRDLVELFAATEIPGSSDRQESSSRPSTEAAPRGQARRANAAEDVIVPGAQADHLDSSTVSPGGGDPEQAGIVSAAADLGGPSEPGGRRGDEGGGATREALSVVPVGGSGLVSGVGTITRADRERHAEDARPADLVGPSSAVLDPAVARVPRLLLLGDVEVEHAQGKAESTRLGRLAETAAFVHLNPNARPSELLAALWPGRNANPQSCRQMISRTRSWLGRTDDGDPYLEPFAQTNGRLRLRSEVRSDWDDFQELAARGMADPDDVDSLTNAMALVRGRPFGSLWRRELAWADIDCHRMVSSIVDVAYELAVRHEAAGRVREARAAVHRAMRTQVESELLDELAERLGQV